MIGLEVTVAIILWILALALYLLWRESFTSRGIEIKYFTMLLIKLGLFTRMVDYIVTRSRPLWRGIAFVSVITIFVLMWCGFVAPTFIYVPPQLAPQQLFPIPSLVYIIHMNLVKAINSLLRYGTVKQGTFIPMIPLLPGITVTGKTLLMMLPAIYIGIVVHELFHAAVARYYNIPLKSGGLFTVLFLLYGGFVEIDEKELQKRPLKQRLMVYGAGVLGNVIVALLAATALAIIYTLLPSYAGVVITNVVPNTPAANAGLRPGDVLLEIGGIRLLDCYHVGFVMAYTHPGMEVTLKVLRSSGVETVILKLVQHPAIPSRGFIGIMIEDRVHISILYWMYEINMALALVNALPIHPLDGGQALFSLLEGRVGGKVLNYLRILISSYLASVLVFSIALTMALMYWW
ncbi:MAG: hypothetical protein DRJ40_06430 [Thermoprotei archaeon]|nr:MAG: hypothetical protein DRJ40_06430 [Thermoprotei archaeon]